MPGYVMPRRVYERVRWVNALRGWGASEPATTLKAFFLGIDVLHFCGAPALHLFRTRPPHPTSPESVRRNHALVARVCFDDRTWFEYLLPCVFDAHLTDTARHDLKSEEALAEHEAFVPRKIRPDWEFWTVLLRMMAPACLTL